MAAGLTVFLECDGIAIFPETEDIWLDDMLIYFKGTYTCYCRKGICCLR